MNTECSNKFVPDPYTLEEPPVAATAGLHAVTATARFSPVSLSKVRRLGLPAYDDMGRKSILTVDFWAWRLHHAPDDVAETVIDRFPEHMRADIRARRAEWREDMPAPFQRGVNLSHARA